MRHHRTTIQTSLFAVRGLVIVLVLSIVLGGHFGGDAEHESAAGQAIQSETSVTYPTDLALGHCFTSVSCQFVLPVELAILAPVAIDEFQNMAASGMIGSPLSNFLFRPPRQA